LTAKLHIQNQARLPLSQQAELVIDGMRYRFFRTLLTWTVVTLAVAFVCYVLAEQKLVDAADRQAASRLDHFTVIQRMAAWIDQPTDARTMQRRVAQIPPAERSTELDVLQGLLGLDAAATRDFHTQASIWTRGENWFDALSLANRRVIFGVTQWPHAVEKLSDAAALAQIKEAASDAVIRLPEDVVAAAPTYPAYVQTLAGHVRQIEARRQTAAAQLRGTPFLEWVAAHGQDESKVRAFLESLGITLSPQDTKHLIEHAQLYQQVLAHSHLEAARLAAQQAATPRATRKQTGAASSATLEKQTAAAVEPTPVVTTQPVIEIPPQAVTIYQQQTAADAMRLKIIESYPGRDLPNRTPWLVGTAFLVCLAGVSNAMLVSVLERFREIATMKCLGAMDGFIGTIFLAEASVIGLIGGLAGGLLGVVAAIARVGWALGRDGLTTMDFSVMGYILLAGIVCGWLLAVLSSIYPAIAAARMPPMAAMRVD
jgi:ABC-type antimicrobial peptide transport system permease subunit